MGKIRKAINLVEASVQLTIGIAKVLLGRDKAEEAPYSPPKTKAKKEEPKKPLKKEASKDASNSSDKTETPEDEHPTFKGVTFLEPTTVVEFVNNATKEDFDKLGIRGRSLKAVMEHRPYKNIEALGTTEGVGRSTLKHLVEGASSNSKS